MLLTKRQSLDPSDSQPGRSRDVAWRQCSFDAAIVRRNDLYLLFSRVVLCLVRMARDGSPAAEDGSWRRPWRAQPHPPTPGTCVAQKGKVSRANDDAGRRRGHMQRDRCCAHPASICNRPGLCLTPKTRQTPGQASSEPPLIAQTRL